MQPLTGPYVYGVNRRSKNFLLLSDIFFSWGSCTRSRYKRVEILVVLGCVFNFWCALRWYTQAWSRLKIQMVIFIELVQYAKNLCGKSRKNLMHIFLRTCTDFKTFQWTCNFNKTMDSKCLFVCFVALRPKSTAMVMAGLSVHLTTLFPGQAWTSG